MGRLILRPMNQSVFSEILYDRLGDTIKRTNSHEGNPKGLDSDHHASLYKQEEESYARLRTLHPEDIYTLIHILWSELAFQLRAGQRVIFDGWLSIFTSPTKRETYDSKIDNTRKMTFAHRIRFRPLEKLRMQAERILTKDEYDKLDKKK